jgi:hypothetical protein
MTIILALLDVSEMLQKRCEDAIEMLLLLLLLSAKQS